MTSKLTYPGDVPGCADVPFEIPEWVRIQEDLVGADVLFRMLAHQYKWKFAGNYRGYWPSRSIRKNMFCRWSKVSVDLDPTYLDTRMRQYKVIKSYGTSGWFCRYQSDYKIIAHLNAEQVRDVNALQKILESQVGELREID